MSNQQSTQYYGPAPAAWYGCYPPGREPKYPWVPDEPVNPWTKENDEEHNKEIADILKEIQKLLEKLSKLTPKNKKNRNEKE
jgi:hypothetical protein